MKEAKPKREHTVWCHLYKIIENRLIKGQKMNQQWSWDGGKGCDIARGRD